MSEYDVGAAPSAIELVPVWVNASSPGWVESFAGETTAVAMARRLAPGRSQDIADAIMRKAFITHTVLRADGRTPAGLVVHELSCLTLYCVTMECLTLGGLMRGRRPAQGRPKKSGVSQ